MSLRHAIIMAHNDLECAKVKVATLRNTGENYVSALDRIQGDIDRAQRRLERAALDSMSDDVLGGPDGG